MHHQESIQIDDPASLTVELFVLSVLVKKILFLAENSSVFYFFYVNE